jgi:hypothetical protein
MKMKGVWKKLLHTSLISALVLQVCSMSIGSTRAYADTAEASSGFETGDADVWKLTGSAAGYSAGFDGTFAHTGTRSYKFASTSTANNAAANVYIANNKIDNKPAFKVEPGKTYDVSVWYYTQGYVANDTSLGAEMSVESFNETTGATITGSSKKVKPPEGSTDAWKKLTMQYTVTSPATKLRINLVLRNAIGTVWYDDVSVVLSSGTETTPGSDPNAPVESGFEVHEGIWKSAASASGYAATLDSAIKRSGARAMKLSSTSASSDAASQISMNNMGTSGPAFQVTGGHEYQVSIWYYTDSYVRNNASFGASMTLESYAGNTSITGSSQNFRLSEGSTGEWKNLIVRYTPPSNATGLRVNFALRASLGTVYFDDLRIVDKRDDQYDLNSMQVQVNEQGQVNLAVDPSEREVQLDSVQLGSALSESAHSLTETGTRVETGGFGQSYRQFESHGAMEFDLAVNPDKQNYVTVKFWGSDHSDEKVAIRLLDSINGDAFQPDYTSVYPDLDDMYKQPVATDRFYYATYKLPAIMTDGKSKARIKLVATGTVNPYLAKDQWYAPLEEPSRGIYQAYSHEDPFFTPQGEDQGVKPVLDTGNAVQQKDGHTQRDYLVGQVDGFVDRIIGFQRFGPAWDTLVASGEAPAMATGAIPLFYSDPWTGTEAEWKASMHSHTIESNVTAMNTLLVLARAYQGQWSRYYHNPELLERYVKALDYYTIAQGANGGFQRDDGVSWVGGPNRIDANAKLEGFGLFGMAESFLLMHDALDAAGKLDTSIAIDQDGNPATAPIARSQAYSEMFIKARDYEAGYRGRIGNQEMANMTAAHLLNKSVAYLNPANAEAAKDTIEKDYLYAAIGVKPNIDGRYTITPKGLGREGNSANDVGGYDGNYGSHSVEFTSLNAEWSDDPVLLERAKAALEAYSQFFRVTNDLDGHPVMVGEEAATWRIIYSTGRVKYVYSPNMAIEHGDANALRFLDAIIQYGDVYNYNFEGTLLHFSEDLPRAIGLLNSMDKIDQTDSGYVKYLKEIFEGKTGVSDHAAGTQLEQLRPADVRFPMEDDQPDFAWADEVAGTVAVKHGDEKLYSILNWRSVTAPSNTARVHFIDSTMDRVANVKMSTPGLLQGLNVAKYGNYVIVMNRSFTETHHFHMTGVTAARELISGLKADLTVEQTMAPLSTKILYLGGESEPVGHETLLSGPDTAAAGQPFDLTYKMQDVTTNVYAQSLNVHYDNSLFQFVSAQTLQANWSVLKQDASVSGNVYLVTAGLGNGVTGTADVLTLHFRALAPAHNATGSINLSHLLVADGDGVETILPDSAVHQVQIQVTEVDKSALFARFGEAQAVRAAAKIHATRWGYYPEAAANTLQASISAALVVASDPDSSQQTVDAAELAVLVAVQAFKASVNQTAGIGDLAILAANYGKSESSAGAAWSNVAMYDVDFSGKLDLIDLISLAIKIQ